MQESNHSQDDLAFIKWRNGMLYELGAAMRLHVHRCRSMFALREALAREEERIGVRAEANPSGRMFVDMRKRMKIFQQEGRTRWLVKRHQK